MAGSSVLTNFRSTGCKTKTKAPARDGGHIHRMKLVVACTVMAAFWAAGTGRILAGDLTVGPGQAFARLEEALAKAQPGDVIKVLPPADNVAYDRVALLVNRSRITLRSAGPAGRKSPNLPEFYDLFRYLTVLPFPRISPSGQAGNPALQAGGRRQANSRQAAATSGAFRMADTTQMRCAPAARTSSRFVRLMPPMANHGMLTCAAAQRT